MFYARIYANTPMTVWKLDGVLVQEEYSYKEYYMVDAAIHQTGTEDFSLERLRELDQAWVYTWDGKSTCGLGKKKFACRGMITYRKSDRSNPRAFKNFLRALYECSELQIR